MEKLLNNLMMIDEHKNSSLFNKQKQHLKQGNIMYIIYSTTNH